MKTIYHLRKSRQLIADAQAASLSPKPFGLKTTHGLFGSDQWWQNVEAGLIPQIRKVGTITRLFRAGMNNESQCFEMVCSDGQKFEYDCVVAEREDRKLYKVGAPIELTFVENELKQPVLYTNGKVADTHVRSLVEIQIGEDLKQKPPKS